MVGPDETAIGGRVMDARGIPVPWAVITLGGASPEHRDIAAVTDGEGRYRFDNLTPGIYSVLVTAEDRSQQAQQVQADAGRLARLDFQLPG